MQLREISAQTQHRPWPVPKRPWQFYQEWNRAIFLHWQVEEAVLRPFVPDVFEIDKIDGQAWISVVAFDMDRVRPRYLPAFAPVSNFLELNVRTYIRHQARPTVYFLSLEANNSISCWLARSLSELPYQYALMERDDFSFTSKNERTDHQFFCEYELKDERHVKSDLDRWLTERYGLFHDGKKSVLSFDIHHIEWPMQGLILKKLQIDYKKYAPLIAGAPDQVNYSPGVQVLTWGKRRTE